jgi:hypothetical protein
MGKLYEQLSSHLRATPTVRRFVESLEQLPGLENWSPPQSIAAGWPRIVAWGQVVDVTRSLPGAQELHGAVAASILRGGEPDPDTLAELSGAALCIELGAIAAGRIPEGENRTADWRMIWPEDAEVDVEVACAQRKPKHVRNLEAAKTLAAEVSDRTRSFDVVVDIVDPRNADDRQAVKEAIRHISANDPVCSSGRWAVRALPLARGATVLWTAGQDSAPVWWPSDLARNCFFARQLATVDAKEAPPQVRIWFGVPFVAYINPVMRKADRPQHTEGLSFLVVVDITNLPGAFEEMTRVIAGFLPFWTAVGGVLIFRTIAALDRVGWSWRLIRNPSAAVLLPGALCNGRADLPQVMDVYEKL